MKERTIKITLDEESGRKPFIRRRVLLITLGENGAEIRASGAPVASRDTSIAVTLGEMPNLTDLIIAVEEVP